MSFSRAFKYPFHNSPKVISIVLVMTIAFVVCMALIANSGLLSSYLQTVGYAPEAQIREADGASAGAVAGVIGLFAVLVIGGFWMNGYSMSAIREVMHGFDTLPDIEFGKNVGEGFWLFLSGVLYIMANIGVWLGIYVALNVVAFLGSFFSLIATVACLVAAVAFAALSGWAFYLGMARCALTRERAPLFEIVKNIGIARENVYVGVRLALRMVLLTVIYFIVRGVAELALGAFAGAEIVVATAMSVSVYYFFNLFQHFSTQHLIAQFALAAGVGEELDYGKLKSDYD